jgi:hypothetical protein
VKKKATSAIVESSWRSTGTSEAPWVAQMANAADSGASTDGPLGERASRARARARAREADIGQDEGGGGGGGEGRRNSGQRRVRAGRRADGPVEPQARPAAGFGRRMLVVVRPCLHFLFSAASALYVTVE